MQYKEDGLLEMRPVQDGQLMQGRRRTVAVVLLLELEEVHSAGVVEGYGIILPSRGQA